jgi:type I restriction enzyme S subunit
MAGEWETLPVAEAPLEIIDGDRGLNYPKQEDFGPSGDCLFLNTGNVTTTGFNFADRSFITKEKDAALRKGKLKRHDVVLTTRGTVGNVALFDDSIHFEHVRINSGMVLLRADESKLWPRFLFQFVRSPLFKEQVAALTTGSAQPQLPIRDIRRVEIPLPPLAEQKAIAAVLGALDDKIELNRRMNATLEAMARALFQRWFVDFDPVRAKLDGRPPAALDPATAALFPEHLEESPLGHIPQGWTAGKLGDIGTNSRRGIQPTDIAPNTPYIALEHMPRGCIALGDWDDSADVASGKSAFKKGEILFGKLRPYFHKVGVAPFDGVCSTDILVLAPKSPEWFGFLLGHASSNELIQFTDLASTGTKMPRTNWGDISSFKVALPPKPLAAAFTHSIQPMLDRIHANLHQSRTLATLRDTLLPKLLSGEIQTTI